MKLQARFLQLPLAFDAALLAREIATIPESAWRPHPAGFAGNDFLPLVAVNGDPANETFDGPMRPTPYLSGEAPYLWQTLASLGAVLGRTRLMRLSGHAEVSEHCDVNYYWRERMRVHVPIVTQPVVKFYCGDAVAHMAAGECWIFDTWSLHRVINDQTHARIHLVADTVGGDRMLQWMAQGRMPDRAPPAGWSPRVVAPGAERAHIDFETLNVPVVMSPWEIREHLNFLLAETAPNQPSVTEVARLASRFAHGWRAVWSAHGENEAGWPRYQALLDGFMRDLKAARAGDLLLVNHVDFLETVRSMVLEFALVGRNRHPVTRVAPGA
jgi:Aspartyl/Asparaginyl beta-hydroxylase